MTRSPLKQRHGNGRFGQPRCAGRVLHLHARAIRRPVADEPRLSGANDLAHEAVAERERPARERHARLGLVHDFDHLAHVVVQAEHKPGRFHDPSQLTLHDAAHVADVAARRSSPSCMPASAARRASWRCAAERSKITSAG